jgi:hypothetical protein
MTDVLLQPLATPAAMEIGEVLNYGGRSYVLLGMEPMSVPDRKADLQDTETGEIVSIPCAILVHGSEGFAKEA